MITVTTWRCGPATCPDMSSTALHVLNDEGLCETACSGVASVDSAADVAPQ